MLYLGLSYDQEVPESSVVMAEEALKEIRVSRQLLKNSLRHVVLEKGKNIF